MEEAAHLYESNSSFENNDYVPNNKRPRSASNDLPPPKVAKTMPGQQGLQINYLQRLHDEILPLASTEDPLPSILRLIGEYEGVLQRHESIAGNLGACPLGSILLKRFERLFDGPPHILKTHGKETNVTWLDVVEFVRNKPEQFNLEKMRNGVRVCQFYTKQCRVEISEEDFVLIASGMPQKLIPSQPIEEDEEKELVAIQILERNLGQIVQLADQLSGRARQLNHKLGNRRNAIVRRRETAAGSPAFESTDHMERNRSSPISSAEGNGFSKEQQSSMDDQSQSPPAGFTAINMRQSVEDIREPDPRLERLYTEAKKGNVTIVNGRSIKGASPELRDELMKKFFSSTDRQVYVDPDLRRSSSNTAMAPLTPGASSKERPRSESLELVGVQNGKGASTVAIPSTPASLLPHLKISLKDLDDGGPFKAEMVSRMESMQRGERVIPPCDRCRRLHMDCLKNLTACMGCTKKHAKCSWKEVRVEELQRTVKDGKGMGKALTFEESRDDQSKEHLISKTPPAKERSLSHARSQPASHVEAVREVDEQKPGESLAMTTATEEGTNGKVDGEKPRFDVRPPPMVQQQVNGRGQYTPFSYSPQVKASIEHDETDEGDRLQALAAQVYRSASQSVRPQAQEG